MSLGETVEIHGFNPHEQHTLNAARSFYERGLSYMSCHRLRIVVILVLVSALTYCLKADASTLAPKIDPVDLKNIMLVKDVKPGMIGYGLTVFRGTKIETFKVEVLGVLKKINSGADMVIIKMSGGPMTTRGANLIQGMSGSPIYVNGKLLGAFSMGEAFVKEPIGMVTPIEYMLDAWDSSIPTKPSSFLPFNTNLDSPIRLSGKDYSKVVVEDGATDQSAYDSGALVFRPLAMPFYISGASPRMLALMQDELKPFNLRPMAGPGTATDKANLNIDLKPGAGIGVSLITGDMDFTGIGTITYRRGNKILAFGHPMLGIGAIDAPLTSAYVYDVSPNMVASSKLAGPIKVVGRLTQDRPWSIGGILGKGPEMIPVIVHITDKSQKRKRDFEVQVANHPLLTKTLVLLATVEGVNEMRPTPTDAVAKVKFEVTADEVGAITRENTFFDSVSIESACISELQQLMNMLHNNPFHSVAIKKVNVWVELDTSHPTAKLERIFVKSNKFEPGDTINVGVVLRPFNGERVTKTVSIKLPDNMPSGQMTLQVGKSPAMVGGLAMLAQMMSPGLAEDPTPMGMIQPGGAPSGPSYENLQQMIQKFLERDKNNELAVRVLMPKPVLSIAGEKFSGLPTSISDIMKSPRSTPLGTDRDEIKQIFPTDWVISGSQRLTITVRRITNIESKSSAKKSTQQPGAAVAEPPPGMPPGMEDMGDMEEMDMSAPAHPSMIEMSTAPPAVISPISEAPKEGEKPAISAVEPEVSGNKPDAEAKKPDNAVADKPVIRSPITWSQTSKADFLSGTFKNVVATSGDLLRLGGSFEPLYDSTESYIWCVLPDGNGNVYAGTGNHGLIYKISAKGTSVFFKSPELEIQSLAMDSAGNIYAGTSPHGIIYKIDPQGKAVKFFSSDEKYILALASDSKGNIYAAVGDRCKVYKISPAGTATVLLQVTENNALALAVDKSDNVYVGTGVNGLVYKVTPEGKSSVVYDADEDSVTALGVSSKGVLYVGTSPKGAVYKIAPDAAPKAVCEKCGSGITSISVDDADNVYAVNSTNLFSVFSDDKAATYDNKQEFQFICSAFKNGRLYLGTGNIGSVYTVPVASVADGSYESPTHDCGLNSKWGSVGWNADLPKGASVQLQTRSGNSAQPDSTWSAWSALYSATGDRISSPQGRFIQYRAILKAGDAFSSPTLKDVNIIYLPDNRAPKVTLTSPKGGEKWSKKRSIKWQGVDPDKDTLTYELFCSSDNGKTWLPLKDKVASEAKTEKPETPKGKPSSGAPGTKPDKSPKTDSSDKKQQMLDAMSAELAKHPELPQEFKDQIMAQGPNITADDLDEIASLDAVTGPPAKPGGSSSKQTSFSWDTSTQKDGTYLIKVIASDRLSNPVGALTDEAVSGPVIVSNKPPCLVIFKKSVAARADKSVFLQGVAFHSLMNIAGVQYRIDSCVDWAAAAADDGLYDSPFEAFTITTQPMDKGEHTIEIKAIDQAGNSATTKQTVKIE